jgi:predicted transcriptional regulator
MTSEIQTKQVKAQIDIDGLHFESSGTAEELIPQILQFVSHTIPTYDLARKLMYVPDLAGLADRVSEFAKMTNSSQLLLTQNELPAERSISIVLFMAHLAAKFAKRPSDSLNIEEIATAVSKAPKTIRNTIVRMQKIGLIERTDRGNYRITQKGLMGLEDSLKLTDRT